MNKISKDMKKGIVIGVGICVAVFLLFNVVVLMMTKDDLRFTLRDKITIKEINEVLEEQFYYDYDVDEIKDNMYKAMLNSLNDKYAVYFTEEEYEAYCDSTKGTYSGLGVTMTKNAEGDIAVVRVHSEGGAAKTEISKGDILIEVAGTNVEGLTIADINKLIKGDINTTVNLKMYRESENRFYSVDIARTKYITDSISYMMLENSIGYIKIDEFNGATLKQFEEAMDALEEQGQQALIIDIRNNPGGNLSSVVAITDIFVPEGVIVYTEDKFGKRLEQRGTAGEFEKEVIILTNEKSASAAELFASAMRDFDKATIVGTTTYGKGIVQRIYGLPNGGGMKLTISQYFTKSETPIHEVGIVPDYVVELEEGVNLYFLEYEKDEQLKKAVELLGD